MKSLATKQIEEITKKIRDKYKGLVEHMDKACAPCEDIPQPDSLVTKDQKGYL